MTEYEWTMNDAAMDEMIAEYKRDAWLEGWKAGAEAMREACAAADDCGCPVRKDVLATLVTSGEKRAGYVCPHHGDLCAALHAAAIRALPIPERPE